MKQKPVRKLPVLSLSMVNFNRCLLITFRLNFGAISDLQKSTWAQLTRHGFFSNGWQPAISLLITTIVFLAMMAFVLNH